MSSLAADEEHEGRLSDAYNKDAGTTVREAAVLWDYEEPLKGSSMCSESLKGSYVSPEETSEIERHGLASPSVAEAKSLQEEEAKEVSGSSFQGQAHEERPDHDAGLSDVSYDGGAEAVDEKHPADLIVDDAQEQAQHAKALPSHSSSSEADGQPFHESDSFLYEKYSASLKGGDSHLEEEYSDELKGDDDSFERKENSGLHQAYEDPEDHFEGDADDVEKAAEENIDISLHEETEDRSHVEIEDRHEDYEGYEDEKDAYSGDGSYEFDQENMVDEPNPADDESSRRSHDDDNDNLEPSQESPSQDSFASSVSSVTMLTLESDSQRKTELIERKRQERWAAVGAAGVAVGGGAAAAAGQDEAEDNETWELEPVVEDDEEDTFDEEGQLQREMDECHDRRKREEKARRIARRSISRPRDAGKRGRVYGNDSLADLEASIQELRASLDLSMQSNATKKRSPRASRKSVRSIIKTERGRMEGDENREEANVINLVLIGFEELLEILLKVSDELGE